MDQYLSEDVYSLSEDVYSIVIVKIACDREDSSFMAVPPTTRMEEPFSSKRIVSVAFLTIT